MPVGFPDYYGGLTLPVTVPEGGTGQTSITSKAMLYGAGTSKLIETNVGTSGQVLAINPTTLVPTFQDLAAGSILAGDNISISGSPPTVALATSPVFKAASDASGLAASFQDASSNDLLEVGVLTNTTGGRGWLTLSNPGSDPTGVGFQFKSDGGAHTGLFQLDGGGSMVFRQASGHVYFDYGIDLNFRYYTGGITALKIDTAGNITLHTPLAIGQGGTGSMSPSLTAGSNIDITGSWPDNTIAVADPPQFTGVGIGVAATHFLDILDTSAGDGIRATILASALTTGQGVSLGIGTSIASGHSGFLKWQVEATSYLSLETYGNANPINLGASEVWIGTTDLVAASGIFSKYNAISTVGDGIPYLVAQVDLTGQTGTISSTTIYTPGTAGMYRLSIQAFISSLTGTSTLSVTTGFTQNGGSVIGPRITGLSATSGDAVGDVVGVMYCDASTAIAYATTWSSGGGSDDYDLHIRLEKI